jgi:enoyl-CoA hydratase/carnithine racemase
MDREAEAVIAYAARMFEITLNGPGKNSLGTTMMQFLVDELGKAAGRPVLLTGAGDAFSAGLDLREVMSLDAAKMETFLRLLETMTSALYTYPAPLVAHVNGHAIAGGCIVAMACDWRVAPRASKLKIGLNEVALGLRFPPRIMQLVRKRADPRHAQEIVVGAALYGPEDALRLGLVDELSDEPAAAAARKLAALSALPPVAYAAAKADLRGTLAITDDEDRRFVRDVLPTWVSDDLKARLAKVLAR